MFADRLSGNVRQLARQHNTIVHLQIQDLHWQD